MTHRYVRLDLCDVDLVLVALDDAAMVPTPSHATARLTPEGYLIADAYIARDGLLRYSDGQRSWLELRPRAELESSLDSWVGQPVTDDHPAQLVDATTHTKVARGVVMQRPSIEVVDGVAYVRTRIKITDAALVQSITTSKRRQLSIGFEALVDPQRGTFDGQRYDAVQTCLIGNHVAVVDRGRAGPAVRLLGLDSATCLWQGEETPMRTLDKLIAKGFKLDAVAIPKLDEVGMPTTTAVLTGPDGAEVTVPTWIAALVQEAVEARKAAGQPTGEVAVEGEQAPAELDEAAVDPALEDPEKKKKKEPPTMKDSADAIRSKLRSEFDRHLALVRKCDAAKIDAAKIDACKDDIELARLFVAARAPHLKSRADAATGDALEAYVEAAHAMPVPDVAANPWERPQAIGTNTDSIDPEVERHAQQLFDAGIRG